PVLRPLLGYIYLTEPWTALVAVIFQPARERLQRLANRLVYGHRASPYEVPVLHQGTAIGEIAVSKLAGPAFTNVRLDIELQARTSSALKRYRIGSSMRRSRTELSSTQPD